jgi:YVTN family beta-propeller protein
LTNQIVTTIAVGVDPTAIAVNPSTDEVYVNNFGSQNQQNSGSVSVISGTTNTVIKQIYIPINPVGISVDPTTNEIYVVTAIAIYVIDGFSNSLALSIPFDLSYANIINIDANNTTNDVFVASNNSITVFNGESNQKVAFFNLGMIPNAIGSNSNANIIYIVANNEVTVLNIGQLSPVPSSSIPQSSISIPNGIENLTVNSVSNEIFASGYYSGLEEIDGSTNNLVTTLPFDFKSFEVNSTTNQLYATDGRLLYHINLLTDDVVTTIPMNNATAVGVNPNSNTVYVVNKGSNFGSANTLGTVSVINGASDSIVATVTVGVDPFAIAVDPVTNRIYVANIGLYPNISVIDALSNTVIATIPAPGPSIEVNPVTNELYALGGSYDYVSGTLTTATETLTAINGETDTVISTLSTGQGSRGIAVNPTTNQIYVINSGSSTTFGNLSVIDGVTNTVTSSFEFGIYPNAIAVNSSTDTIYIADESGIEIVPIGTNTISISSISPNSGSSSGGTAIAITGTNFTNTDTVDFGTTPASSVTYVSATQLTAVSPPGTGSVGVQVAAGSQVSNSIAFGYTNTVYTPVSPTRICDTRPYGSGAQVQTQCNSGATSTNGPLSSGQTLNINVQGTFGTVTVPSTATAVVLNVTVTGTTQAGGFLTVYPTGATQPNTSVINFGPNDTIANLVQVGVGQNGQVSIYNFNGSTNVIVDLEGYYAPVSSSQGLFVPISPVRVCDTRSVANGSSIGSNQCNTGSNSTMTANSTLTVNVSGTGPGGTLDQIPSGAVAVVANITATNTTQPGGFLTAYPTPSGSGTAPVASNLNFGPGISIANRVIVPIGQNGDINIYNFNGSTDVIVDINGYFTGPTATSGNSFNPIVPTRICDTRPASGTSIVSNQCDNGVASSGSLGPQGTISVQVSNISTIPSGATAVVLNVTVTNTTSNGGFLTIYPKPASGTTTPSNSDLNWSQGETIANQVVVEVGANDSINVFNSVGSTDLIIDIMGYYS